MRLRPAAAVTDFRTAAGHRPIGEVLGELVTRKVERYRSRRLRAGHLDPREITDALEHAAQQQADLAAIVDRLERLHRSGGGDAVSELRAEQSWDERGDRLRQ